MNEIKLCKLVSGEMIVGRQVRTIIKNCLLIHAMPSPDGQQIRMGISPYMAPYTRAEANIDEKFCVVITDADPELVNQYQQITTGIVTAKPNDLKNLVPFPPKR